jgi:pimeloyl-ACP methyl ester carboxylesterase
LDHVEIAGLRVAYERAGGGRPLVLLPGYVGDARGTFGAQLDELSDEFTIVAWDPPGAGASSDPPEGFGLSDYADCLAGFVEALGLERPHLGGLSFGGGLALEFVRRHPHHPASLVLAGAYAGWRGSLGPEIADERLEQAVKLAELPPDRFVAAVLPTMFSRSTPAEVVDAFGANISAFHPAGLRAMARAFAEADLRDVLPRIEVPTLLLYGDEDQRAPMHVGEELHAGIAGSKLVVLAGVGHASTIEAPEQVNAEIRAFLRSLPS